MPTKASYDTFVGRICLFVKPLFFFCLLLLSKSLVWLLLFRGSEGNLPWWLHINTVLIVPLESNLKSMIKIHLWWSLKKMDDMYYGFLLAVFSIVLNGKLIASFPMLVIDTSIMTLKRLRFYHSYLRQINISGDRMRRDKNYSWIDETNFTINSSKKDTL